MSIKNVNIIGAGNVGSFLAKALSQKLNVVAVYSRELSKAEKLASIVNANAVNDLSRIDSADLNIMTVTDDSIEEIASELDPNFFVVHTSGSVGIDVFNSRKLCGVFYPLQTITSQRQIDPSEIPFLIEASLPELEKDLVSLAHQCFSENTLIADSKSREQIHLAAVFVNNFTNHLFSEAEILLKQVNTDLSILYPLMTETVEKAIDIGPLSSQTGPAKRMDKEVMIKQIRKLQDEDLKRLYILMSELIQKRANS